jgi:hypothetical protein
MYLDQVSTAMQSLGTVYRAIKADKDVDAKMKVVIYISLILHMTKTDL